MHHNDRYPSLQSLFDSIVDSPAAQRESVLAALDESDPDLAREARGLLRAHERRVPALDDTCSPAAPLASGAMSLIGLTIDGWTITRCIGRGGWSDVYEAKQNTPARTCALKVLRWPWLCTPRMLRRFHDEAELLARVEHPAIAHVYGAGVAAVSGSTHADLPYMALELVPDAQPITTYLAAQSLTRQQKLSMFAVVCDAVHSAHRRGVLHRDLKPSNILVGTDARPRVIDFGIACATDHAGPMLTVTGEFIGTVGYMSPERLGDHHTNSAAARQPHAEPPDARWDVYSLGVILYEILTGKPPFELPANIASAVAYVQRSTPTPAKIVAPDLPRDLCTIISAAMERDPARRYQSVADLAADITRFLEHRPIAASPTPTLRRIKLAAKRRPALAVAALSSLIGMIAVTATGFLGWHKTKQELRATEHSLNVLDDAMTTARARRDGDQVRISDLLERLERPLKEDADLSPRVAARVHEVVARTYEDLADYPTALVHYQAGLDAAKSVWSERDPFVVRLKVELAGSLYDKGDPAAAAAMLEDLLAHAGTLDDATLAKVMNDLAVAYMKCENWLEGERVGLQAYALRCKVLGADHAASVQSLINLGANALRLSRLDVARERLDRALTQIEKLGRDGARMRIHALSHLGLTLAHQGDAEASRQACDRAAAELAQTVGSEHPLHIKLSLVWAEAALERGDTAAAATLAHEVHARAPVILGESHPDTRISLERATSIAGKALAACNR